MFVFVLLFKMAFEDDREAQHTNVAKEEEARYNIVVKAKETVEAGSVRHAIKAKQEEKTGAQVSGHE